MEPSKNKIQNVADTAFWVAYYRAIENEKNTPLFRDPYARLLTGEQGKNLSASMKPIERYAYWSITIRTRLVDELIQKYINIGYKTIINLGAGLDTRPYRLDLPADVQWIEIDFPSVINLKNEKLADRQPTCQLERIGLDLSDRDSRKALFDGLNQRVSPAIILTEGVIPYLSESSVAELASDIKAQPSFDIWISEYFSPEVYRFYQSPKLKKMMGNSPFQFFPSNWLSFFEDCGWVTKEMRYHHDVATQNNRPFPLPWWVTLIQLIVGKDKVVQKIRHFYAYIVFERINLTNDTSAK